MKNFVAALMLATLGVLSFAAPSTAAEASHPHSHRTVLAAKGLQGAVLTPTTTLRVYLDNGRVKDVNADRWAYAEVNGTPHLVAFFGSVVGWVEVPVRFYSPGVVVIDR